MVKIAIIVDGEFEYAIYRHKGHYYVDFGCSTGMSAPLTFKGDTKAISWLQDRALETISGGASL